MTPSPSHDTIIGTAPVALRLVAFDLDDTLAASKSRLDPRMARLIAELVERVEVCVISGGQFAQFSSQLIDALPRLDGDSFSHLHLMPTCGTQYYRHESGEWARLYAEELTDEERNRALDVLEQQAKALGLWETKTYGDVLEDRGSQVTFSALGQAAPVDEKKRWDPDGAKKESLRAAAAPLLPDLEVRSGGSTSVDITRQGVDKAYGMQRLSELTGIGFDEMLFFGDRLDEGGNDFPVLRLGIAAQPVTGWEDTAARITKLVSTLPLRSESS